MYSLGKEGGLRDDQLLFWQNPRNESDKITLRQILEAGGSDVDKRQGGCFAGHVPKFPQSTGPAARVTSLPPSTIHALLPLNAFREQPAYMFEMGKPLWDCMQEVRKFTGFYLAPNHFGSIVYAPPEAFLNLKTSGGGGGGGGTSNMPSGAFVPAFAKGESSGSAEADYSTGGSSGGTGGGGGGGGKHWTFAEISGGKKGGNLGYNQYQTKLHVPYGHSHIRNAVMTFGLIQSASDPQNPVKYTPIVIVKKQPGWPYNVSDYSYIPWLKWLIMRNPHWNDFARLQQNTNQRFLRSIMPRTTPTFSAWGHALLYPYDIVNLDESEANETGIDGTQVIVESVTKNFDAETKTFRMDLKTEYVDFSVFQWSPHENQGNPASNKT